MDCETDFRLSQLVVEASRALDDERVPGTNHEKKELLLRAEINKYEHERGCLFCYPLPPLAPTDPLA